MARIYFDEHADLKHISDRLVAVVGYGNQGRSQALNLRDAGVKVTVGSRADRSADQARADGFKVASIADAAREADILMLLLPDEVMPRVYKQDIAPRLRANMVLDFAHGFNVTFKQIVPPEDVDVVMVAPRMIGRSVREPYFNQRGFPSLIAVEQDASNQALEITLALAKGIGSTKVGAVLTTFREETIVDLFTEQSGGLLIMRLMFETLVNAGFDPDVVLLELYASGELAEIYAAARDMGLWCQLPLHSRTSQFGQLVTAKKLMDEDATRGHLQAIVEHIQSGAFAEELKADSEAGSPNLVRAIDECLDHDMHLAERRLYQRLGREDHDLTSTDWTAGFREGEGL